MARAREMVTAGAAILDIGGESTRPGAEPVSEQEEMDRVLPVIELLAGKTPAPLALDTRKPRVMAAAREAGAAIWNDVSALTYAPDSLVTAARLHCPVILMHARGDPKTMQDKPFYDDVVKDVRAFLEARIAACLQAGIVQARLIIDPGIGFGKSLAHNLALLNNIHAFDTLGCPVLIGASRKRFIGALSGDAPADRRLGGSIAVALRAAMDGARVIRVHDVAETRQALDVWEAMAQG